MNFFIIDDLYRDIYQEHRSKYKEENSLKKVQELEIRRIIQIIVEQGLNPPSEKIRTLLINNCVQ